MNKRFLKYYKKLSSTEKSIKVIDSQLNLIKLLAKGDTIKEIALKTNAEYWAIQKRTQLIYKKFGVKNRLALITKAIEQSLIKTEDVSQKFHERFVKMPEGVKPELIEKLARRELMFLFLWSLGCRKKKVMELLNLPNLYFCNYLITEICKKLNAKNITQAVIFAYKLKLINILDEDE